MQLRPLQNLESSLLKLVTLDPHVQEGVEAEIVQLIGMKVISGVGRRLRMGGHLPLEVLREELLDCQVAVAGNVFGEKIE